MLYQLFVQEAIFPNLKNKMKDVNDDLLQSCKLFTFWYVFLVFEDNLLANPCFL